MKAKTHFLQLLVATAIACFAASASAGMYKWTDKQGNVHYTETPPDEGNSTEIAPPPRVAAPASNSAATKNAENDNTPVAAGGNSSLTPEQQELYKHNCEAAKANLETFKYARRVQKPDGEFIVMDDANRQKMTQEAQDQIQKFCK